MAYMRKQSVIRGEEERRRAVDSRGRRRGAMMTVKEEHATYL